MNARIALPIASMLLAAATSIAAPSGESFAATEAEARQVVDLPVLIVRPAAADALHYRSRKIVDLATITVHPDPRDLAVFVTGSVRRVGCLC